MPHDKIDIVYLWVDGSDKKWRKAKDIWYKKVFSKKATDQHYFRDNGEFLYSLRSVAKYANWVNHIYIITGFNQKPKWLNTKNPRITIVPHEQIIPKNALPTFNSNSIDMCIPNIPGLSEKFILMNDDTFFNKHLSPSFFFDRHGHTRVRFGIYNKHPKDINHWLAESDEYTQTLIRSAKILEDVFGKTFYFCRPSHGIDPYLKSSWIECANIPTIKKQIQKQIKNKFRTATEIQRWTFNLYDYISGRAHFTRSRAYKCGKHKILYFIYNILHWGIARKSNFFCSNAMYSRKAIIKSPIFCINDAPNNTPEILKNNINFLKTRFPNKCEFEK